jgi:phage terminase small subunit
MLTGRSHHAVKPQMSSPSLPEIGTAPGWLTSEQVQTWDDLKIHAGTWLKAADGPLLAALCVHYSLFRQALKEWDGTLTASRPSGVEIAHPALLILRQQTEVCLRLSEALALTPMMRQRLNLKEVPRDDGWGDIEPNFPKPVGPSGC